MSADEHTIELEFENYFKHRDIHLINKCTIDGGTTLCYVFSAGPNPDGKKSGKVGSVVFVNGDKISVAFTTGSPLFEDNFDFDTKYQTVPVENCVFGALKLIIEIDQVSKNVDASGINLHHVKLLSDNFMKIDQCIIEQSSKGKFPAPEKDPLVHFVFSRQEYMHRILMEKESRNFAWFKAKFLETRIALLEYIPQTIPKVAKMGVGRNVMYMDFVRDLFEIQDCSKWAVYFARLFFLRNSLTIHNGVYPLLWHMFHYFGYQQEWSKDDAFWAMKNENVPEPSDNNGPLCYFKKEYNSDPEHATSFQVRNFVLKHTAFPTNESLTKKLGSANNQATLRFAAEILVKDRIPHLTDDFIQKEREMLQKLKDVKWTDWFNQYFGTDTTIPIGDKINLQYYTDVGDKMLLSRFNNACAGNTIQLLEFLARVYDE